MVIASAVGILLSIDANILKRVKLTKDWAKSLLFHMDMVKRRVSSKAKVDVEKFEALKQGFLLGIKFIVSLEEIPPDFIINWDQLCSYWFQDDRKGGSPKSRTYLQR